MNRQALLKKRLPDSPGVYFFLERNKKILYIGRASSLRNRVRSYFGSNLAEKRSEWIAKMLTETKDIEVKKTDSVLEAILLEADLIKKFQPTYNTKEKDDKSFNCITITNEEFPRVMLVRKKNLLKTETRFGPFPQGTALKEAMKITRKIFPWRDEKCRPNQVKPCFNRQIGLCPGVCTGAITAREYRKQIAYLKLFLSGKKKKIIKTLEHEMKQAACAQEFERAGKYKRQLFALTHIQDIALLKQSSYIPRNVGTTRIEAYDLSHFGGKGIVGAMAVVEEGVTQPSEYRLFKLRTLSGPHEVAGLQEILRRRLKHTKWPLPQQIAVDGNEVQKKAAEAVLRAAGLSIPVTAVVKDEHHRPREKLPPAILLANSEAHRFVLKFQRKTRYTI